MNQHDDNENTDINERLLKALKKFELSRTSNRRSELLKLVRAQYEELYSRTPSIMHPVFGEHG